MQVNIRPGTAAADVKGTSEGNRVNVQYICPHKTYALVWVIFPTVLYFLPVYFCFSLRICRGVISSKHGFMQKNTSVYEIPEAYNGVRNVL